MPHYVTQHWAYVIDIRRGVWAGIVHTVNIIGTQELLENTSDEWDV